MANKMRMDQEADARSEDSFDSVDFDSRNKFYIDPNELHSSNKLFKYLRKNQHFNL